MPLSRDGKPGQSGVATLGRVDQLAATGTLDRLLRSDARFADSAVALSAFETGEATRVAHRQLGPALVFERLWRGDGMPAGHPQDREFAFDLEHVVFLSVLPM